MNKFEEMFIACTHAFTYWSIVFALSMWMHYFFLKFILCDDLNVNNIWQHNKQNQIVQNNVNAMTMHMKEINNANVADNKALRNVYSPCASSTSNVRWIIIIFKMRCAQRARWRFLTFPYAVISITIAVLNLIRFLFQFILFRSDFLSQFSVPVSVHSVFGCFLSDLVMYIIYLSFWCTTDEHWN